MKPLSSIATGLPAPLLDEAAPVLVGAGDEFSTVFDNREEDKRFCGGE
jgi:hypothetical protein